jgi:glycosyltransferase involved in cell wall biosynthesis
MKLLFYTSYFYPYTSGITTYPFALFSELVQENLVTVLTFPHTPKLKKFEVKNAIHIHRMPYWFKVSKGYISPQSLGYFYNEARKNDIIILNMPNFEGVWLAIIGKILRKPVIALLHCQVDLGTSFFSRVISFFLQLSISIQLLLADKVVINTKEYARRINVFDRYKRKIVAIPPLVPAVPVDETKLQKLLEKKANETWVGFAGRTSREKGIEFLIKAVAQISQPIRLVFAGPYGKDVAGEQEYYQKIMKLLKKYNIPNTFLGKVSRGELGAFYKSLDVLVLPSINKTEAYGMVQAEAMRLGTPAIGTNLPGVRIPIRQTGMGLIVKPSNTKSLASAIVKILKNKEAYASPEMTAKAQQVFDPVPIIDSFKKLFASYQKTSKKRK